MRRVAFCPTRSPAIKLDSGVKVAFCLSLCCAGIRHKADLPTARHSMEREGASPGRPQRTQRPPWCVHGDKRGRQEDHPISHQLYTKRSRCQATADARSRPAQDVDEDRKSGAIVCNCCCGESWAVIVRDVDLDSCPFVSPGKSPHKERRCFVTQQTANSAQTLHTSSLCPHFTWREGRPLVL